MRHSSYSYYQENLLTLKMTFYYMVLLYKSIIIQPKFTDCSIRMYYLFQQPSENLTSIPGLFAYKC